MYMIFILILSPARVNAQSDLYEYKNTKTQGFVEVLKNWIGSLGELPDIRISSDRPTRNPNGYTAVFEKGNGFFQDGSNQIEVVYTKSGSVVSGVYKEPSWEYGGVEKWVTSDGIFANIDSDGSILNSEIIRDGLVLSPVYENPIRYAVSVWGIYDQEGEDGNKVGLTFGPGVQGRKMLTGYMSHEPIGSTENGNNCRCIHADDWKTISKWAKTDASVYQECLENGCTKAVILDTDNDLIVKKQTNGVGDGYSILKGIITGSEYSYDDTKYYWNESKMRAYLNGVDDQTDVSVESDDPVSNYVYPNCLFGCFPKDLQRYIVKTKSVYTLVTPDTWGTCESYDNLFIVGIGKYSFRSIDDGYKRFTTSYAHDMLLSNYLCWYDSSIPAWNKVFNGLNNYVPTVKRSNFPSGGSSSYSVSAQKFDELVVFFSL